MLQEVKIMTFRESEQPYYTKEMSKQDRMRGMEMRELSRL